MIVELDKKSIIELMEKVPYGYYYLVVSLDGRLRTQWVAEPDREPVVADDEYAALIPQGIYEDELDQLATRLVDTHIWEYIKVCLLSQDHIGDLPHHLFVRYFHPDEWREEKRLLMEAAALDFLMQLNHPDDSAAWGYHYLGDGYYAAQRPPFTVTWMDD